MSIGIKSGGGGYSNGKELWIKQNGIYVKSKTSYIKNSGQYKEFLGSTNSGTYRMVASTYNLNGYTYTAYAREHPEINLPTSGTLEPKFIDGREIIALYVYRYNSPPMYVHNIILASTGNDPTIVEITYIDKDITLPYELIFHNSGIHLYQVLDQSLPQLFSHGEVVNFNMKLIY